jgi:hypothetical protein
MDTSEWITVKKGTSLKSANISTTTSKSAGKVTKKDYMPKPTVSFLFTSEENLKYLIPALQNFQLFAIISDLS